MKFLTYLLTTLVFTGCATNTVKKNEEVYEEGATINLPKAPKESIIRSPFFNTQKSRIGEKNGFVYDFYYGSGGRYLVVITPPKTFSLNYSQTEGTLLVDVNGIDPEIISLAVDKNGLLSGIGSTRNGKVEFKLSIKIPGTRYFGDVNSEFNFFVNISDESFN